MSNDGGRIVPEFVFDDIIKRLLASNPYGSQFPPPAPLTRRQRWVGRLHAYRWRVNMAIDVLRNRHDCGDL